MGNRELHLLVVQINLFLQWGLPVQARHANNLGAHLTDAWFDGQVSAYAAQQSLHSHLLVVVVKLEQVHKVWLQLLHV
jgi:hypothetical protein